jgi:hypothetical protein
MTKCVKSSDEECKLPGLPGTNVVASASCCILVAQCYSVGRVSAPWHRNASPTRYHHLHHCASHCYDSRRQRQCNLGVYSLPNAATGDHRTQRHRLLEPRYEIMPRLPSVHISAFRPDARFGSSDSRISFRRILPVVQVRVFRRGIPTSGSLHTVPVRAMEGAAVGHGRRYCHCLSGS